MQIRFYSLATAFRQTNFYAGISKFFVDAAGPIVEKASK